MTLGVLGILLAVAGAILLTQAIDLPSGGPVDSSELGWILLIAGVVTIVLLMKMSRQPREPRR